MEIITPITIQTIFRSNKKERIAKQVQIILDMFGGTLVKGGENEN